MTEVFDRVAHRYTRSQAIADGLLVDLTAWASGDADDGMVFGFTCPVAVTAQVARMASTVQPFSYVE